MKNVGNDFTLNLMPKHFRSMLQSVVPIKSTLFFLEYLHVICCSAQYRTVHVFTNSPPLWDKLYKVHFSPMIL